MMNGLKFGSSILDWLAKFAVRFKIDLSLPADKILIFLAWLGSVFILFDVYFYCYIKNHVTCFSKLSGSN
jgi:hypothetical protein